MPMPKQAKNYNYQSNYGYQDHIRKLSAPSNPKLKPVIKTKKNTKKETSFCSKFISFIWLALIGIYICLMVMTEFQSRFYLDLHILKSRLIVMRFKPDNGLFIK